MAVGAERRATHCRRSGKEVVCSFWDWTKWSPHSRAMIPYFNTSHIVVTIDPVGQ